ncbi:MAG: hypothetical protein SH859_12255 [Hyphomicrobium aestuarii]|jgi:hypothetical protein|nr:hypothetical protein [Hyphomicrobium aestuarii]
MEQAQNISLDTLSVRELTELQEQVQNAIRLLIRQQNELRAAAKLAPVAKPVTIDLERERDAWLAKRRGH